MQNNELILWISAVTTFLIIVAASQKLGDFFTKIKLPLITGFIIIGVLTGPFVLKIIPKDISKLNFINEIALGFIALAAGAEMELSEIKQRSKPIFMMTISQIVITFVLSFIILFLFVDKIPVIANLTNPEKLAFIFFTSTIFIAPSLATTIPLVNELRAKGNFTKTVVGVTVLKDIILIIIFAIVFSISNIMVTGGKLNIIEILLVFLDIILSIAFGILFALLFKFVQKIKKPFSFDVILFVLAGWSTFLFADFINKYSNELLHFHIHIEAILIGITASFYVVNYTGLKNNLHKLVEKIGPFIYVAFFTLIGISLSLDSFTKYWLIVILFSVLRLILLIFSSSVGSILSKDPKKEWFRSWTPHVAQAGVSLGLISIVAINFPVFGKNFEAILVGMIIINQFIGPPLSKLTFQKLGEAHVKGHLNKVVPNNNVYIIGVNRASLILAKQLISDEIKLKLVDNNFDEENYKSDNFPLIKINDFSSKSLKSINFKDIDSVVIFKKEHESFEIAQTIYENFGTKNVIVNLEKNTEKYNFKSIGAIVVEPASAVLNLLEHFVLSPKATSLIMGFEKSHKTEDIEILCNDLNGIAIEDLKLPIGILLLSVTRKDQMMLPHGYTRLKKHDIITVIGNEQDIQIVKAKMYFD